LVGHIGWLLAITSFVAFHHLFNSSQQEGVLSEMPSQEAPQNLEAASKFA